MLKLFVNEAKEETIAATSAANVSPKIPFGSNESIDGYAFDLSPPNDSITFPSKATAIKPGKTTTIGMMLGLIKPTSGSVYINDKKIRIKNKLLLRFLDEVFCNLIKKSSQDLKIFFLYFFKKNNLKLIVSFLNGNINLL